MEIKEILRSTNEVLASYSDSLDQYSEAQFEYKQDAETWSLSQMYEHVCMSGKKFFLANTKRCLEKRNGEETGEMNRNGVAIFANGGFPDAKFKMPEALAVIPIVGNTKEFYKKEIAEIISSAELFAEGLTKDAGTYKIFHPVLGFLNAKEWYQNLEMHSRHHLKQKAELEALASNV